MSTLSIPVKTNKKKMTLPSATSYLSSLVKKEISVTDYVNLCLSNYDLYESKVHAWVNFDRELVLERAALLDQQLASNLDTIGQSFKNRLYGVPIGIKDTFNTVGMPTEHGSPIFKGYTPGNDARVVTDIRRSNAIVFGKTAVAELGVHTPGPTRNPLDLTRTPGTSSSGSAAAVACGMLPLALSSQTNGSTIRPASYCGIIGYKPSFGVLPRTAMLKTTDTLDTVAILGSYLPDIKMLFNVLRVKGRNYPIVNKRLVPYPKLGKQWKVGIIQSAYSESQAPEITPQLEKLSQRLVEANCELAPAKLPALFDHSFEIHTTIYHRALSYYFKREWELYPELFSAPFSEVILDGNKTSVESYHQACSVQTQFIEQFDKLFDQFDILVCPSAATEAPLDTDEHIMPDDNHLVTMCHVPSISLPLMHGESGLPIGLQFIARKYHDYKLFDFCHFLQNELCVDVTT